MVAIVETRMSAVTSVFVLHLGPVRTPWDHTCAPVLQDTDWTTLVMCVRTSMSVLRTTLCVEMDSVRTHLEASSVSVRTAGSWTLTREIVQTSGLVFVTMSSGADIVWVPGGWR